MAPKVTHYTIYQGNNKTIPILIVNETDGAPVDADVLEGALGADYGVFSTAEESVGGPYDPTPVITKVLGTGVSVEAATATVTVFLLPVDTEGLAPGKYLHELKLTLADGQIYTALQDEMEVLPAYLS